MSGDLAGMTVAACYPPAWAWLIRRSGLAGYRGMLGAWAAAALTGAAVLALAGLGDDAAASGASGGVALYLLFRDWWRRKGRRAARAVGAKSLAVLAAVVERAREAGTPAPEGARA